jgi:ABC-type transport system substrate-binding protein
MYQPDGWWDLWDALVKELDSAKRIEILKQILKLAYDEVVYIPYQGDAPLVAMNPDLYGFEHHANHMVSFWDPGNCWIGK